MASLAVKYRPQTFEDGFIEQKSVAKILRKQLETESVANCYLFAGASGCGKTTSARIFANALNKGLGQPIEIDAASNNGVDNVRMIIKQAQERSLSGKYKVFIIDECHLLSNSAWGAFLKLIEEPPAFTIFIFCTTDVQKVPATIINRVQRYNFTRISVEGIKTRLRYICEQENFTNFEDGIDFIAKISDGGMRDAIANLEVVSKLSTEITVENTLEALGNFSYETFFELINAIIDGDVGKVVTIVDDFYNSGNDMKLFVDQFLNFVIDLAKYSIFKSCDLIRIPNTMVDKLDYTTKIGDADKYFAFVVDRVLNIKNMIRNDTNIKSTVQVGFINLCRGI